jgi:hypothetical protein
MEVLDDIIQQQQLALAVPTTTSSIVLPGRTTRSGRIPGFNITSGK